MKNFVKRLKKKSCFFNQASQFWIILFLPTIAPNCVSDWIRVSAISSNAYSDDATVGFPSSTPDYRWSVSGGVKILGPSVIEAVTTREKLLGKEIA